MVTQNDWLASIAGRRLVPPIGMAPASSAPASWATRLGRVRLLRSAVIAASGGPDRAGDEAGHLLGRALRDRLVGDLVAAAQHDDAIGDGEDVGHAMADQEDGDAAVAQE